MLKLPRLVNGKVSVSLMIDAQNIQTLLSAIKLFSLAIFGRVRRDWWEQGFLKVSVQFWNNAGVLVQFLWNKKTKIAQFWLSATTIFLLLLLFFHQTGKNGIIMKHFWFFWSLSQPKLRIYNFNEQKIA